MENIDYVKVRGYNAQRKIKKVFGYKFLPLAPFIVACRLLDWRHTEILEFIYTEVEEFKIEEKSNRIDNNDLSKMVSYWRRNDLISYPQVEIEKSLIENSNNKTLKNQAQKEDINIFGSKYSVSDFMKELEKKSSVVSQDEYQAVKQFFEDFKEKYDLQEMVSQYLAVKDNQGGQ